ncbi:MAG: M14 family zinc carboxypeptidase [Planctomycetaceae bacterium]
MKVARLTSLFIPLALIGCANPRTFSSGGGYGGTTYSPAPYDGGFSAPTTVPQGGSSLGESENGFTQRSPRSTPTQTARPPAVTTPVRPSKPAPNVTPTPAPKGPTLGLPTAQIAGAGPLGSDAAPTEATPRPTNSKLTWNRRLQSAQKRPIETLLFGTGTRRIVVLASLHGDEPQSVGVVEQLAQHLASHPDLLAGCKVLLVRCTNPDGLEGRFSLNSRGVDLNRNFPGSNWSKTTDRRSGSKAASEPETAALVKLLTDFKPTLLVHVKDSRDVGRINSEGNCVELADQVARLRKFEVMRNAGTKTTGSLENFAASRLNTPALTVLLPLERDDSTAWDKNREALLSIIQPKNVESAALESDEEGSQVAELPAPPESVKEGRIQMSSAPKSPPRRPTASIPSSGYHPLPQPEGE